MYSSILGGLSALFYLMAGGLAGIRLSRAGADLQPAPWRTAPLAAGLMAVTLHALVLAQAIPRPEGFDLGFFNALSLTGWLIALVLLLTSLIRPVENLGIILLPFSALTVVLALLFPAQRIITDPQQWPLELHILISILAYSLLALASVQAILLAVQDHFLRSHRPGGFIRGIPPLVTMEALLFQLIRAGFWLLSLALISGFLFLEDIFAQHLVHKTVLSTVAWGVFGILLWGRRRFGWRGRKAIRWTLSGFTVLVLAYFGSKLVLELLLDRPWSAA
ncbi:MAG: cytochrome c biogenesis protein CcsA [Candidatus Competibacteraceae bacterium]|nr:cytochrome c biogenesis protein CcsA [Candidatus Competibacteraceae bacterium]